MNVIRTNCKDIPYFNNEALQNMSSKELENAASIFLKKNPNVVIQSTQTTQTTQESTKTFDKEKALKLLRKRSLLRSRLTVV